MEGTILIFRGGSRLKCSKPLLSLCWNPGLSPLSAQPAHVREQGDVAEDSSVAGRADETSTLSYLLAGLKNLRKWLISLSLKFIIIWEKAIISHLPHGLV